MKAVRTSEALPTSTESQRLLSAELVVGLLAAVAALLLLTWLSREVLQGEVLAFDDRLRTTIHGLASPRLTAVMRAASLYGGPSVLIPLGLLVAIGFLFQGRRRGAMLVVVTLAGAGLLNLSLKLFFGRLRPTPFFDYPLPGSASFPSGHSLFAASFFGGLAVLVSARMRDNLLRAAIWIIAIAMIALVGVSRIYFGVHHPSDVIAGYAAATVWVTAVAFGDRLASHRRRRRRG
jgi:membrane-associated phospholipid phosphatase